MPDLSLVPIDELLAELYKRHDACVFLSMRKISKEEDDILCNYSGGRMTAIGLMETCMVGLITELAKPPDEEGDPV